MSSTKKVHFQDCVTQQNFSPGDNIHPSKSTNSSGDKLEDALRIRQVAAKLTQVSSYSKCSRPSPAIPFRVYSRGSQNLAKARQQQESDRAEDPQNAPTDDCWVGYLGEPPLPPCFAKIIASTTDAGLMLQQMGRSSTDTSLMELLRGLVFPAKREKTFPVQVLYDLRFLKLIVFFYCWHFESLLKLYYILSMDFYIIIYTIYLSTDEKRAIRMAN